MKPTVEDKYKRLYSVRECFEIEAVFESVKVLSSGCVHPVQQIRYRPRVEKSCGSACVSTFIVVRYNVRLRGTVLA